MFATRRAQPGTNAAENEARALAAVAAEPSRPLLRLRFCPQLNAMLVCANASSDSKVVRQGSLRVCEPFSRRHGGVVAPVHQLCPWKALAAAAAGVAGGDDADASKAADTGGASAAGDSDLGGGGGASSAGPAKKRPSGPVLDEPVGVSDVCYVEDGALICLLTTNRAVVFYKLRSKTLLSDETCRAAGCTRLPKQPGVMRYCQTSKTLFAAGGGLGAKGVAWSIHEDPVSTQHTLVPKAELRKHTDIIQDMVVVYDDENDLRFTITAALDTNVHLWDPYTCEHRQTLTGKCAGVAVASTLRRPADVAAAPPTLPPPP